MPFSSGFASWYSASTRKMSRAFEVNVVGVVRVSKALESSVKAPGGKIAIISSLMGSCGDNGSGGFLQYRVSKAAVNMAGVTMACDLKEKGVAVVSVNPGMVQTHFGPGPEAMGKMGAMPVEKSVEGLIQVFDQLSMETTGSYMMVYKDKPPGKGAGGGSRPPAGRALA